MEKDFKDLLENLRKTYTNLCREACDLKEAIEKLECELDGDPVMPFGKHEGKKISEVPVAYIGWLFSSGSLDKYEHRTLKLKLKNIIEKLDSQGG